MVKFATETPIWLQYGTIIQSLRATVKDRGDCRSKLWLSWAFLPEMVSHYSALGGEHGGMNSGSSK